MTQVIRCDGCGAIIPGSGRGHSLRGQYDAPGGWEPLDWCDMCFQAAVEAVHELQKRIAKAREERAQ